MIYVYAGLMLSVLGGTIAALLQLAERYLADYGPCNLTLNDRDPVTVDGGCTLLDGLHRNKVFIPSACGGQATCGFCKVTVQGDAGPVLPTELPYLGREEIAAGVRLACQVKVKQDLVVRVRPDWLSVREFSAQVAGVRKLTHDTREITLKLIEPGSIEFSPGQYIQVLVPGTGEPTYRAYSISSPPRVKDEVQLVVRHIAGGLCSTYLHRAQAGDGMVFTGPYGDFSIDCETDGALICVAGGCGVAPIMSIVRHLSEAAPGKRCAVFLGFRSAADIVYADELKAQAGRQPGLDVHIALSDSGPSGDRQGETGMIHESVAAHVACGGADQAFLCGPPPMIEATLRVLREKGLPRERVFYDEF